MDEAEEDVRARCEGLVGGGPAVDCAFGVDRTPVLENAPILVLDIVRCLPLASFTLGLPSAPRASSAR